MRKSRAHTATPPQLRPGEAPALEGGQLACALEATDFCVCTVDDRWRFTGLNERARSCFGATEALLGRSILRVFPGIRHSIFSPAFRQAMLERKATSLQGYLADKGAWYDMNIVPTAGGVTFFFRDISDTKRSEARAMAASDQMRATLDNLPQMLWAHWTDRAEHYYSRYWKAFTGVSVGEPGVPERIELVHPDDRERAGAIWQQCLETGEQYQADYRMKHVSGEYRWIQSRAWADRDSDGRIIAWYGACADIHDRVLAQTALDRSERRFRAIIDSMPHIVWSMAADGRQPDYYNKRWYEFTGLPPGSFAGPGWEGVFHPDDAARAVEEWRAARISREPYETEYRLRHHSGEYRWVVSRGRFEADADGETGRWYGTCTDVHQRHMAREALDERQKRVETILDTIPQIIWSAGPDGRIDFLSNQWDGTFGSHEDLISENGWAELLHPNDRQRAFQSWRTSLATGEAYECEFRLLHPSAEFLWVLVRALPERNPAGEIIRWYGTCTDIHQRVVAQEALHASEALNRSIIEASPDCVAVLDLAGKVLSANEAATLPYGVKDASILVGRRLGSSLAAPMRRRASGAVARAREGEVSRIILQAGETWWDLVIAPITGDNGSPTRLVAIARDVTEQKLAERSAHWSANHDALTGLANRSLLQERLDEAIETAVAYGRRFALLLLDVDDFKRTNDSAGHDAGDALLCTFADRLRNAIGPRDTVARLGGDEFAIVLGGVGAEDVLERKVAGILASLREPCAHNGRLLDCHASIGASLFPLHGANRPTLLKNADVALYTAKSAGGATLRIFKPAMRDRMQLRASMLNLARDAIHHRRILPHYQPKVNLKTGAVDGFEALLRWRDPLLGIQLPGTIHAAFEDFNLAAEISDRMIQAVIGDLARWRDQQVDVGHIAINAAAAEFRRGDFADRLLGRLERAGLPPRLLQVEVTETVFLGRGADYVERALKSLSQAGVKIALDDFGTGYASLSHLKQFPVNIIKIDRSFVEGLAVDPNDVAIIDAVVNLARSLGIDVVAEGIETAAQHRRLQRLGCNFGQGYLYGKAGPAAGVAAVLQRMPQRWARLNIHLSAAARQAA